MTTMENFFETMKTSAKYAVVAASLTSMLVTGFPGAAQAQEFIAAKNPSEIAQIEASYIAGKEMGNFRHSINVMVKTDIMLRDTMMTLESAHWRLKDMDVGKAAVGHVLRGDYMAAKNIDLSAVKDIVKRAKDESGLDFEGVAKNMEQRLEIVTKMEQSLEKIADAYNANDAKALKDLFAGYDSQGGALRDLYKDSAMGFLRPAAGMSKSSANVDAVQGNLKGLAKVDYSLDVSVRILEKAVLQIARGTDTVHSTDSLLSAEKGYTAAKDVPLDQVREIAGQVKNSGIDVDGVVANIEQRAELIGRMETRLNSIIKDYYTNDTESLAKNLNLYDMESFEHARLTQDSALDALHPDVKMHSASSTPPVHRRGSTDNHVGLPINRTQMLLRMIR
ncbi:hypothetical protein HFN89_06840 [Rhizobium laguerreae]|nr:hypothetical protein [Rhizobium laguerreae]